MHFIAVIILCSSLLTPPASDATADNNILTGPSVEEQASPPSIVKRSFDGMMEETDPEPDRAAIALLKLSDEQQQKFQDIVSARLSAFDECVRRNYGLVLELATIQGETNQARVVETMGKVREAFESFIARGSCLDEMKPHLSADQVEQVISMVTEYREARVAQLRKIMGDDVPLQRVAVRARLEAFGHMLKQSIERQVVLAREGFEEIANELNLTEEQRSKTMAIFQPLFVKQFQRIDTPAERAEAFRQFREMLNAEQKLKLFAMVVKQWRLEAEAARPEMQSPGRSPPPSPPAE